MTRAADTDDDWEVCYQCTDTSRPPFPRYVRPTETPRLKANELHSAREADGRLYFSVTDEACERLGLPRGSEVYADAGTPPATDATPPTETAPTTAGEHEARCSWCHGSESEWRREHAAQPMTPYQEDRKRWIEEHGSERLRLMLEADMLSDKVYFEERIEAELGDEWLPAFPHSEATYSEPLHPSAESLKKLLEVRAANRVRNVRMCFVKVRGEEEIKGLALRGDFLGRWVLRWLEDR